MIDIKGKNIDILGTTYYLDIKSVLEDEQFKANTNGYTDLLNKKIVLNDLDSNEDFSGYTKKEKQKIYNCVLRHELIHAYLYESGLDSNSGACDAWSRNEEMVDWFAIQSPKIYKTFSELGILWRGRI